MYACMLVNDVRASRAAGVRGRSPRGKIHPHHAALIAKKENGIGGRQSIIASLAIFIHPPHFLLKTLEGRLHFVPFSFCSCHRQRAVYVAQAALFGAAVTNDRAALLGNCCASCPPSCRAATLCSDTQVIPVPGESVSQAIPSSHPVSATACMGA